MRYADTHCDISDNILYAYPEKKDQFDSFVPAKESILPHQIDLKKIIDSKAKILFWSMCPVDFGETIRISSRWEEYQKHLSLYRFLLDRYSDYFQLITDRKSAQQVIDDSKKIGVVFHIEGMDMVNASNDIDRLYEDGVRSFGLCGITSNQHVRSGTQHPFNEERLNSHAIEMIQKLNAMPVCIDLAHMADGAFFHVLEIVNRPVIVSHTNARAICEDGQNMSDDQLRALKKNGALVSMSAFPLLLTGTTARVSDFVAHIEYVLSFLNPAHIAIGSDFDGMFAPVGDGMETMSAVQSMLLELEKKIGAPITEQIAYKNVESMILSTF